jgi:hypothetical protein
MVFRLSKKQKNNKKRSIKNNLVKNQYGGMLGELFERKFDTPNQVGAELGIIVQPGRPSIIDPVIYSGICAYLRTARNKLNNLRLINHYIDYYRAINFFLYNVNLLSTNFLTQQPASSIFYFHFYDGDLYPDPVQYNQYDNIEDVQGMLMSFETDKLQDTFRAIVDASRVPNFAESRPQYNNIVISSIFITTRLLDNIYNTLDTLNRRLMSNPPADEIQRIRGEYFTIIKEIIRSFLGIFTVNLVKILTSTEPKDIAYISVLHNDVSHLYELLVKLPQCAEVDDLLKPIVLHLYLKQNLPQRFSFLKCIIDNPTLFAQLAKEDRYRFAFRCQDIITIIDDTVTIPGQTPDERQYLFLNLIVNTITRMRMKNSLNFDAHRPYYDLWPIQFAHGMDHFNTNSNFAFSGLVPHDINILMKSLHNNINILLTGIATIPLHILSLSQAEQLQYIQNTQEQLLIYLFFLRVIIYNNRNMLDTFLVCLLTSMVNSIVTNIRVNTDICNSVYYIIELCYSNYNFRNYLANQLTASNLPHYANISILTNGDAIYQNIIRDFNNLIVISNENSLDVFTDPFTTSFIFKLGVITSMSLIYGPPPKIYIDFNSSVTPAELDMLINVDLFILKKTILLTGINPFNQENMTLDDLDQIQLRYQNEIDVLKTQKVNLMPLLEGTHVRIDRLRNNPSINGSTGTITEQFNSNSGTWTVTLDNPPPTIGKFKPANLTIITPVNYN